MIRRILPCRLCVLLLVLAIGALCQPVPAAAAPERVFGIAWQDWIRSLDALEGYLQANEFAAAEHRDYFSLAAGISDESKAFVEHYTQEIDRKRKLLEALGPPPAPGEPAEDADVAERRAALISSLAIDRTRLARAELASARAGLIIEQLTAAQRRAVVEPLFQRQIAPFSPDALGTTPSQLLTTLATIVRAPFDWFFGLSAIEKERLLLQGNSILILVVAFAAAGLRRAIAERFAARMGDKAPSYSRRFAAFLIRVLCNGILPSCIFLLIVHLVRSSEVGIPALPAGIIVNYCWLAIFLFITLSISTALLRPKSLEWRLTSLAVEPAVRLHRRLVVLIAVFAVDRFLVRSGHFQTIDENILFFYRFWVGFIEAVLILSVLPAGLWRAAPSRTENKEQAEPADKSAAADGGWDFVDWLRAIIGAAALAGVIALLLGYIRLAEYLINNLLVTSVVLGALFLVRTLLHEVIRLVFGLHGGQRDEISEGTFSGINRMILIGVVDVLLVGLAIFAVLPRWGIPFEEISHWLDTILTGFTIGGVTISLIGVAAGVAVLVVGMLLTRGLRAALSRRVLPRTELDPSIQTSITAGIGYIGVGISILVAVTAAGLDLSQLAIVAGALSVGIGFGLQNIVNNFVSGIILLVERPVKVGDWVVVGSNQGFVKRINVRATEIETFERATVIVPNSELLSTSVINWTHRDRLGRVDVRVGVAYGTDPEKVSEILLTCAREHAEIVAWPKPFVLFVDFGASSLDFELRAYVRDVTKRLTVGSELRYAVEKALREARMEIPFTQVDLHIRDADNLEKALGGQAQPPDPGKSPAPKPDAAPPLASRL